MIYSVFAAMAKMWLYKMAENEEEEVEFLVCHLAPEVVNIR